MSKYFPSGKRRQRVFDDETEKRLLHLASLESKGSRLIWAPRGVRSAHSGTSHNMFSSGKVCSMVSSGSRHNTTSSFENVQQQK